MDWHIWEKLDKQNVLGMLLIDDKGSAKKCIKKVITEIITEKGIKYLEENG